MSAGARALVTTRRLDDALALPVLWRGEGGPQAALAANADACVVVARAAGDDEEELAHLYADVLELGLDCVVEVVDEEELERALEPLDPRSSCSRAGPPVATTRSSGCWSCCTTSRRASSRSRSSADVDDETLDELERAGVDAVIVGGRPARRSRARGVADPRPRR